MFLCTQHTTWPYMYGLKFFENLYVYACIHIMSVYVCMHIFLCDVSNRCVCICISSYVCMNVASRFKFLNLKYNMMHTNSNHAYAFVT